MSAPTESKGPVILAGILWYGFASSPATRDNAFLFAIGTLALGWLTLRMIVASIQRLGRPAWIALGQLVIALAFFMVLLPAGPGAALTLAWLGGMPILLGSMAARWMYDRLRPSWQTKIDDHYHHLALPGVLITFGLSLWMGDSVLGATVSAMILTVLAWFPGYFGWQLGASARRDKFDARTADTDGLRERGLADDL